MSSIALFRLPHNWTIPFQRFFLQFCIFTQRPACARAVAWRPVQANILHCVAFHIRANAFRFVANALISFLAYMLLHFLENTFCQPKLGSALWNEMIIVRCCWTPAEPARKRFSVIFADDNALSAVDDKMTGPAQRRLNDSKFWQSYKSSWQGVLTNSYNFALSALANPYNFDNAGFDFKIFRLRLSATFNSLASLFVYPVKCFGSITFSVLAWKIF